MTNQQLVAGELAEVIAAIRAGAAYANVHTTLSTGGEIRGQTGLQALTSSLREFIHKGRMGLRGFYRRV